MHRRLVIALALICVPEVSARAGFLFGPRPYLSQADSPFDLSGLGTTMFLEDFEQGVPTTPGIPTEYGVFVEPPGPLTDSVDADDGVIDGYGNDGYSLRSQNNHVEGFPTVHVHHWIPLDIDTDALGFTPNVFGFVLTDGPPLASLFVMLMDNERHLLKTYAWGEPYIEPLFDHSFDGGTAEDKFFGIYEPEGITFIQVGILTRDETVTSFEMDHVQYGLAVPEPSTITLSLVASAYWFAWVRLPRFL